MALAVENTANNETAASASTLDITLTITSANLLMVGVGYVDGGQQVSGVVWDPAGANESLTQLIRQRQTTDGFVSELWYLKAPTAGSAKPARVTLTGALTGWGGAAIGFTGADQATTFGTAVSALEDTGSDPITVTATTASGEIVVDFIMAQTLTTVGANQTAIYDSAAVGSQLGSSYQAGADGGVMSWTKDGGGTQRWVTTAVSVKPSGGGGPSTARTRLRFRYN